jgi:hypothetical protein
MRYEVEQTGGSEHRPDAGTHAEPERWHVVRVFDVMPMPPRCDTLEQTLAYTLPAPPSPLRIVGAWISTGSDDEQPLES